MMGEELVVIRLTFYVALVTSIAVLPLSLIIAWVLARKKFRGKALVEALITLPLVAPPVVTGYMLLLLFGRNGWVGRPLFQMFGIRMTFNFFSLICASLVVSLPLAVRSIRASFEMIDPMYETVAQTLGKTPIETFFRVSLPMALPGVLSAMVLTFARSLGEFGATITLAGNIPNKTQTISLLVYSYMQVPGMEKQAALMVLISLAVSFLAIAASEMLNKRHLR
ncbi:molybdate ABC transporter permease subunit [Chitinispirillales bacterium ANBcel5]|uniref:molybdate ABC transporter permease subunit n=1 Tax=Cellulosispirillum alkaliphilum TaxID=3039283 RepID=UPI002A558794|nr:molybdate ABC transporter permease subunit [Chitinispirillales bacterium ANBcel5]